MALIWNDRVLETSTTTGTGAFALDAAVTGYQRFSAAMSVADTCYYFIEAVDANGNPSGDWETGLGTYSSANTLTRTTPQQSSNADAAVNFAAGSKRVALTATAAFFGQLPETYQPLDSDLTAIAALSTATFGRSLLTQADAAAARTTLGVTSTTFASAAEIRTGTEAAKAVAPDQLTAAHVPVALTDAAPTTWNMANGFNRTWTLGANRTLSTPTNPKAGMTYVLEVIQDATGGRTVTWPASFNWGAAGTPTLSTGANKVDLVTLYCRDAATPKFRAIFSKDA